jgi:carbonic anhydrase
VANKADPKAAPRTGLEGASPRLASTHAAGRPGSATRPTDDASAATGGSASGHGAARDAGPHWSYVGPEGPEAWSHLSAEAAACGSGQRQSPIDIRDTIAVNLAPIAFAYRASAFTVRDTGHTIEARWKEPQEMTVNGRRFSLVQMHFHLPSEERVNGQGHAMVAHLVHRNEDGQLAVVAIFLDPGPAQPLVQAVWDALPLERGDVMPSAQAADLSQLLPADPRYFTYMGSLTTPPCTEGVLWLVMKQPVSLSPEQLAIFARFYPMNARPIQPAGGRVIKEGL